MNQKTNEQQAQEKLYIIRWTFENFASNEPDHRVETYTWEDRQQAITRYLALNKEWYAHNIRFQVAQPQDVDIDKFLNSF